MRALAVTLCVVLIAPVIARAADPFESAPAPQASPPRPAYHPRPAPREEERSPEPLPAQPPAQPAVATAPQPPRLGDVQTRVRQVGQAQGIPVPLAAPIRIDVAGTAQQYWPLLGAWGPATWAGSLSGDKLILVVKGVDEIGGVDLLLAQTACCAGDMKFGNVTLCVEDAKYG